MSMKRLVWVLMATAALVCAQGKQTGSGQNVELTVYLLSGSTQGTADDVPSDLSATVTQLHSVFAYKSYKLTESFMLRGRAGNAPARTEGILPGGGDISYEFRYSSVEVSGESPRMFRINGLRIMLTKNSPLRRAPDGKKIPETLASIQTDLDIREGQKTVVGKSSVSSTGDALILVIVPKIVE